MCWEKINVMLYGGKPLFGGKEKPKWARITYCKLNGCPFREKGTCVNISPFMACPYGKTDHIKGYTSRAKKSFEFNSKYRGDALYGALDEPSYGTYVVPVGDYVFVHLENAGIEIADERPYGSIKIGDSGNVYAIDPMIANRYVFIPSEHATPKLFVDLCKFTPRSWGANIVKEFGKKTVPRIMEQLRKNMPETYREVIKLNPRLEGMEVDYIGMKAKTMTIRDGSEIKDRTGNVFVKNGDQIECKSYSDCLAFVYGTRVKDAYLAFKLVESDTIEIKDNSWVDEGTEFV